MFSTFLAGWQRPLCSGGSGPLCLVLLPTFQYATLWVALQAKGLQNARYPKGFSNLRVAAILASAQMALAVRTQSSQV